MIGSLLGSCRCWIRASLQHLTRSALHEHTPGSQKRRSRGRRQSTAPLRGDVTTRFWSERTNSPPLAPRGLRTVWSRFLPRGFATLGIATVVIGAPTRIESQLAEILTAAEVQHREQRVREHEWRVQRRAEVEEETRRRQVEAERQEREQQEALAAARVPRLGEDAASLRHANDIRAYVDAVRAAVAQRGTPVDPTALERWRVWALAEADRIDPVVSGAFLRDLGPEAGPRAV